MIGLLIWLLGQVNEVRYRDFAKTGELVETIDLDTFIKLYVNHRPVAELEKKEIDRVSDYLLAQWTLSSQEDSLALPGIGHNRLSAPWVGIAHYQSQVTN